MTRAYVQSEEWWPVLEITVAPDGLVEVDPALVERYNDAYEAFRLVQKELADLVGAKHTALDTA